MPKTYLEPDELAKLEDAPKNLRDRLLIRLIARTGIRITEALTLSVNNIDLARGTITIIHEKHKMKLSCPECGARLAKSHDFCPKCTLAVKDAMVKQVEAQSRQRIIGLDDNTLKALSYYIETGYPEEGWLFPITRQHAWYLVKNYALKAGLDTLVNPETGKAHFVSPHRLRDAFATAAIAVDDSLTAVRELQDQLGHEDISTTMHYVKLEGRKHRSWYDKVSKALDGKRVESNDQ